VLEWLVIEKVVSLHFRIQEVNYGYRKIQGFDRPVKTGAGKKKQQSSQLVRAFGDGSRGYAAPAQVQHLSLS
jgi:hypothetical protein